VGVCVARYVLDIKPSARKELENLSDSLIARLAPKIDGLAADPRPSGCRKLRGYKDFWRIRVGEYRVVYIIDDDRKMVSVTRVAHRRDVYE
jgi:mRNA interferase RelE/StbE